MLKHSSPNRSLFYKGSDFHVRLCDFSANYSSTIDQNAQNGPYMTWKNDSNLKHTPGEVSVANYIHQISQASALGEHNIHTRWFGRYM